METIDKIVKSNIAPKRTDVVWFNTTDKSQYIFTPDGKWTKVSGGGDSTDGIQEITYLELKKLRNQGKLVPGKQYRITDYKCVVKENPDFTSAGHQFDIIVTADTKNILNENARATWHDSSAEAKYITVDWGGNYTEIYMHLLAEDDSGKKTFVEDGIKALSDDIINISEYNWIYVGEGTNVSEIDWRKVSLDNHSISTDTLDLKVGDFVSSGEGKILEIGTLVVPSSLFDYFKDSNLSAWELKYTLDEGRYAWGAPAIDGDIAFITGNSWNNKKVYVHIPEADNENGYAWTQVPGFQGGPASPFIIHWKDCEGGTSFYSKTLPSYNQAFLSITWSDGESDSLVINKIIYTSEISGTGVIYYMKDEYGNECSYDFKNVLFNNAYTFSLFRNNSDLSLLGNCRYNKIPAFEHKGALYPDSNYFMKTFSYYPEFLNYSVGDGTDSYPDWYSNMEMCSVINGTFRSYYINAANSYSPRHFDSLPSYVSDRGRTISITIKNDTSTEYTPEFTQFCLTLGEVPTLQPNDITFAEATWNGERAQWVLHYIGTLVASTIN